MNSKIIAFAVDAHNKVNHLYDGKSYAVHLAMVAMYVMKYADVVPESQYQNVMNAAWLHDTIEDCRLTYNDIKEVAGVEVAEIVFALTNDKGRTRKERAGKNYYECILKVPFARFVKLCDRLANVKYSRDNKSRMLDVYKKEQNDFINALMVTESDKKIYGCMIQELEMMLK